MQVTQVLMESFPFLRTGAVEELSRLSLPHVWWSLHTEGAPHELRAVAAQMFSLAPTSAAGERSFKQRSRGHSKTRNRLSDDHPDKTQAIITNKRQTRRFYGGVLLQPRTTCAETHMVGMLRRCCPDGSGRGVGNTIAGDNRVCWRQNRTAAARKAGRGRPARRRPRLTWGLLRPPRLPLRRRCGRAPRGTA